MVAPIREGNGPQVLPAMQPTRVSGWPARSQVDPTAVTATCARHPSGDPICHPERGRRIQQARAAASENKGDRSTTRGGCAGMAAKIGAVVGSPTQLGPRAGHYHGQDAARQARYRLILAQVFLVRLQDGFASGGSPETALELRPSRDREAVLLEGESLATPLLCRIPRSSGGVVE